jgi:hypothetical protein
MQQPLQLAAVVFAGIAIGGLMVNWIGLGRAMSCLSAFFTPRTGPATSLLVL